jgi:hypothetical protein
MNKNMENWCKNNLQEKTEVLGEISFPVQLSPCQMEIALFQD